MNNEHYDPHLSVPPFPPSQPKHRSTIRNIALGVILGIGCIVFGGIIGAQGSASGADTKPTPPPVASQQCVAALDRADEALATTGRGFDILADGMEAAGNLDPDGIAAATEKMGRFNTDELAPALEAYKTARDSCKVN